MRLFIIKVLLLLITGGCFNIFSAGVDGYVVDGSNNEKLDNVDISLKGSSKIYKTGGDGFFSISGIERGEHTIEFRLAGYKTASENITINSDSTFHILVKMYSSGYSTPVIVITDEHPKSKFDDLLELSSVLKSKELVLNSSVTLAMTLRNETGISIRSMGPAPSRPVFRGLSGDRVMITEDGIKTVDLSATSPDHSVTIEPFTVERIEILRGPKVLLKSSSSTGGIINIVRNEIPADIPPRLTFKLGGYGELANNGYLGSGVLSFPLSKFVLRSEGTYRKTGNIKSPGSELNNSDIETRNLSLGFSWVQKKWLTGFSAREYKTDYGIPGGFTGSHPNGVDISMLKRQYSIKLHFDLNSNVIDHIDAAFSRVFYKHTEYERKDIIGAEFRITDYQGFINLVHYKNSIFKTGIAGLSFETRNFNIGGYVFSPPSNSVNLSAYISEEIEIGRKWNIEFSARYSFDRIKPEKVIQLKNLTALDTRTFHNYSLSFSAVFEPLSKLNAGISLSKSSRVPTIEELFSDGPHLAAYSYEIGNPELKPETGAGSEVFIYYKDKKFYAMLTGFYNDYPYFIIHRNTGKINTATLLPVYQASGTGSRLYGIESQAEYRFFNDFVFDAGFSYTLGDFKGNSLPLPQIPPAKGFAGIKYSGKNLTAGFKTEYAFSQNRIDVFEQPTKGYVIFGLYAQYSFFTGKLNHNISINTENITNQIYYNHLSRIKSIMPEPGFNIKAVYQAAF